MAMTTADARLPDLPGYDHLRWYALVAGVAGLALCAVGALIGLLIGSPRGGDHREVTFFQWLFSYAQFFRSYLVAYVFFLGIALGSLAILGVQYLTGGAWGVVIRRILEAATRTLLLLAILFLPLFLGLSDLYDWARWTPEEIAKSALFRHKSQWLNVPWFVVRTLAYFAVWLAVAYLLNHWSARQDQQERPAEIRQPRLFSGPALMLYGLTITFASIDWMMSIEPLWYSTIYGVLVATGQALAAFAFAIAVVVLLAQYPPLSGVVGKAHLRDLGSLLLAFVMLWAYISFSQFLLIWAGNLPEEVPWYQKRLMGGWQVLGLALIVLQFVLPFMLLLSKDVKTNGRALVTVAAIVLVMRFVDLFWMLMPAFFPWQGFRLHWMDAAALVGVGGVWLAWFLWQLRLRPLLPVNDPNLAEAIHHE